MANFITAQILHHSYAHDILQAIAKTPAFVDEVNDDELPES